MIGFAGASPERIGNSTEPPSMKLIDVHSHWGTKRGYPLQTQEELALQRQTWNSEVRYHTEAEMAQHFRDNGVHCIPEPGFAKYQTFQEMLATPDFSLAQAAP